MKTRIFNLIILDESGSMEFIKTPAISGVNETIQTIRNAQKKHEDQEQYVSLVSFNTEAVKTIYDRMEAARVEELTDRQYVPSGCTPLYDAMGNALTTLCKSVADDDIVLVTIITDGMENASREYSQKSIKSLVDSLKEKNWVFTYIGANQDVTSVSADLSIDNHLSFCTTESGTKAMFDLEQAARSRFYDRVSCSLSDPQSSDLADDFFNEEEESKI